MVLLLGKPVVFCLATEPHNAGDRVKSAARQFRTAAAFTLVELLVVMSVIALLFSVLVPVFKNMVGGRGVAGSINSVTSILDLGRATAISNQTYVFVLFKNVVNSDNTCELRCAAVLSTNNLKTTDTSVLKPVTKLIKIPSVKNVKYNQMPAAVKAVTPVDLQDDSTYIARSSETDSSFPHVIITGEDFGGATFVRFDPDGEIGTADTTVDPYNLLVEPKICLGLIGTRGTVVQTNGSDGAIVVAYGGSGATRVIRP